MDNFSDCASVPENDFEILTKELVEESKVTCGIMMDLARLEKEIRLRRGLPKTTPRMQNAFDWLVFLRNTMQKEIKERIAVAENKTRKIGALMEAANKVF